MRFGLLALSAAFLFSLAACEQAHELSDPQRSRAGAGQTASSCPVSGTWSRCSGDGVSSTRVILSIDGDQLSETIENWNFSATCQGDPSSGFSFTGQIDFGEQGASRSLDGGTDVDITTEEDFFGCGEKSSIHTVLKISHDCRSFQVPSGSPSCDPSTRGTVLDPEAFVKVD